MKKKDAPNAEAKSKVEIELTDFQFEILDRIIEVTKNDEQNADKEVTRETVLLEICTTFIASEGGRLIKQG